MNYRVPDQEVYQWGPGERWRKRTAKHLNWTRRMLWIIVDEVDKGCLMIRMCVSGWMFLLVRARSGTVQDSMPYRNFPGWVKIIPSLSSRAVSYRYACRKFGMSILRKIIDIVATRHHILKLKCTKFNFGWGCTPDPTGGAYSAPLVPSWI